MFIPDLRSWIWIFSMPDPDPGVKKAPDPGSGFALLARSKANNRGKYAVLRMVSSAYNCLVFNEKIYKF
jgi:hypothetical protein